MYFKSSLISILIAQIDLMERKHDTYRHHIPYVPMYFECCPMHFFTIYTRFLYYLCAAHGQLIYYIQIQIYFYRRFMRKQIKQ